MKRVRRPGLIRKITVLCHYHDPYPYHIMMMLCIVMFMPVIVCMQFEEKVITGVRFGTMIRRIILTLLLLELLILVLVWTSHHNKHRHNNSKYYHSSSSNNKVRMIVGTVRYRRTEGWVWRMCDATTNPAATDANTTNYCRWWIFTLMVRNC